MGKGTNEPGEDTLGQTVHDVEGQTSKHTNTNDPLDGIIQKQIPGGGELALLEDQKLTLEKQKKRRERPPLLYCKLVTKWPLQTFRKLYLKNCSKLLTFFFSNIKFSWQ